MADERLALLEERVAALQTAIGSLSRLGHRHDGIADEFRVFMSDLEPDPRCRGVLPFNYKYAGETSSDTLANGSDASLITAAITPHSTSNILVIGWGQVNNDSANAVTVTLKLKRGSTVLATAETYFTATASEKATLCFFAVESPASRDALTYTLAGTTSAQSPTVTNKGLLVLELPHRLDTTS